MAKHRFTNKAIEDLTDIWSYTFEVWSEIQADSHYNILICCSKNIFVKNLPKKNQLPQSAIFGTVEAKTK